jgi:carboxyl-terminal processing protease
MHLSFRTHLLRVHGITLMVALLLTMHGALSAQAIGGYERTRGRMILRVVHEHLEKHYYDSTFHGINLGAVAARADSLIQVAQSNSQIFTVIAQFVRTLDDSHTQFYPPRRAADVEYGWELQMIGDSCYVVWVEPGSDAAAKGLMVGHRVLELDGYVPTRQLFHLLPYFYHALSPRPAVRLVIESADGRRRALDVQAKVTERAQILDLTGEDLWVLIREIEKTERQWRDEFSTVGDSVLIFRMAWFGDEREVDRSMDRARGVATLILDLRGNPGGLERGLVRLVGHVFDRRVVIDTVRLRREARVVESKPVAHPFAGQLFVLIDSRSTSAAEVFARLVQQEGRGLVIGDRSAGLVMRSMTHDLSTGADVRIFYRLSITEADVIMPDGIRLERRGVEPDSLVLPTAADLAAGRDPVLALALRLAGQPADSAGVGRRRPEGPR